MPQLYRLATIVHAAPATQVSVERLFSGMAYILSSLQKLPMYLYVVTRTVD